MGKGIVARKVWLWGVLSLVLCLALVSSAIAPAAAGDAERGCGACLSYPIMRPDPETLERWIEAYNNAPRVHIDRQGFQLPSPRGSLSLLDHLEYTPSERNQGSCGNCWAWAGTGCLGIALDVQEEIKDRLSVQYLNSCEWDEIGKACCAGGWLSDLADFYDPVTGYDPLTDGVGQCIPWANEHAHWQDGDASCDTACGSISTDPNYPITAIQETTIPTQTVSQATAIANIKDVLNQDKAVWFAFFLPTSDAWNDFRAFWNTGVESDVYAMDQFCGTPYDDSPGEGGGHAVLCVGYNDEDPENKYWIMLNSWGTAGGNRPNGLFRINMDMNYQCVNDPYYSFYWQTLDVTFNVSAPDITVDPTSFDVTLPPDTTQDYTLTIGNDGDADLSYNISDEDCPWLSESPTSDTVGPGDSQDITITINTTGLGSDYSAEIVIASNDPDEDPTVVPVTLHVVEMPDLVISAKYEEWVDFEARSYNITYTVKNQGGAASGASHTRVYIDAGTVADEYYSCPALDPGASDTNTVGPFTMSGDSDDILVYADPYTEVDESDEDNNYQMNTLEYPSYNITLSTDWNLVSLPVIPHNTSIADVTAAINATVDIIWYYNSNTATWLWYVPGNPASTLSTIEDGKGYWFFMNSPAALEGSGWEIPGPGTPPAYDVFVDWNLIGFSSTTSLSPESYLATIAGTYSLIYGWDAEGQSWLWYVPDNPSSTLTTMEPGYGYWLMATADGTIVPPA